MAEVEVDPVAQAPAAGAIVDLVEGALENVVLKVAPVTVVQVDLAVTTDRNVPLQIAPQTVETSSPVCSSVTRTKTEN